MTASNDFRVTTIHMGEVAAKKANLIGGQTGLKLEILAWATKLAVDNMSLQEFLDKVIVGVEQYKA